MSKRKTVTLFKRIESQREEILQTYDQLTSDQLRFKPEKDKWNLLQVMSHLITAEKQSLVYIKRNLNNHENLSKAGPGAYIRHIILQIALWLPVKYKAPRFAEVKEDFPGYDTMKSEWDKIRSELFSILETNESETLAKELYKHPRAGRMNFHQALMFFETHIAHHRKQMERIKSHPSFPSPD